MAKQIVADRYVLHARLGRGGFGEVWQAQDTTLGRQVAVKLVDLTAISNAPQLSDIVARFRREALAVGGLRHANIVAAFDAGQAGSTLYLVMELVPGSSLATVIENRREQELGSMPVAEILDIGTQICAGLSSAHAAGVVHRDIKPGNLMVDPDRHIKIIDFGIARFIHDDMPRLTVPGSGVGTLSYVAPEQAQGLEVDGRADLYSLGCLLYELLAGERPFVAAVPLALLNKQLSEQAVPLRARRPDVPGSLAALVAQLMEKDAAARPASAQEVLSRLGAIRQGIGQHGGPVGPEAAARRLGPEAARPTVLAGDLPTGVEPGDAGQSPGAGPGVSGSRERKTALAGQAANYAETVDSAGPAGQPGPRSWAGVTDSAQPPAGWGGAGPGRRPGRRRRLWATVGALVLLAVAGAAATVVWTRAHAALAVSAVAVAPAGPPPPGRCDVTVDVVGTIITNGRGGTVTYQWTRSDGTTSPVQTAIVPGGSTSEQVHLRWSFRGRGTVHASATLRVLSPSTLTASTSFVYSCR